MRVDCFAPQHCGAVEVDILGMDFAIIKTGGKQYKVSPGQKIKIEKLSSKGGSAPGGEIAEGEEVVFDEVLLVEKDKDKETKIGAPLVKGAKVVGKVLRQGKSKKVTIRKYKAKKRYDVKRGHRQPYTEVEISEIK